MSDKPIKMWWFPCCDTYRDDRWKPCLCKKQGGNVEMWWFPCCDSYVDSEYHECKCEVSQ